MSVILLNLSCFHGAPRQLAERAWTDLQRAGPEVLRRALEETGLAETARGSH